MAKKNGAAAPAAPANPAAPTPATPPAPAAITKMEAVRRALAKMGKDATPMQMQPWIKEQFGIEMNTDHISTCKGDILKKAKSKATKKPAAAKAPAVAAAQPAPVSRSGPGAGTGGIRLEDVQATKELVERIGADRLRALIALFAK